MSELLFPNYTTDNRAAEDDLAEQVATAWRCELRRFAQFSALDWYAVKAEQVVGVVEGKARNVPSDRYPTVYLSVRKWEALALPSMHDVPGLFVVRFTNEVRWCRALGIGWCKVGLVGRRDRGYRHDIEPCIEVPIDDMRTLDEGPW